jgi:hypothetical protein
LDHSFSFGQHSVDTSVLAFSFALAPQLSAVAAFL